MVAIYAGLDIESLKVLVVIRKRVGHQAHGPAAKAGGGGEAAQYVARADSDLRVHGPGLPLLLPLEGFSSSGFYCSLEIRGDKNKC